MSVPETRGGLTPVGPVTCRFSVLVVMTPLVVTGVMVNSAKSNRIEHTSVGLDGVSVYVLVEAVDDTALG